MLEQIQHIDPVKLAEYWAVKEVLGGLITDDVKNKLKPFYDNAKEKAGEFLDRIRLPEEKQMEGAVTDPLKIIGNERARPPEQLRDQVDAQKQREAEELSQRQQRKMEPLVEKPTWEQVVKAEELRCAKELQDQREIQQLALKSIMTGVEKRGNDPVERDEMRRAFEEKCKQQLADKMREQQERMDRLELLYKTPPSGRER